MTRLYTLSVVLLSFFLLSYSSGPGTIGSAAVAGAPGESLTCGSAGCHTGNVFQQVTTVQVVDSDGNLVDSYMPDTEYNVQLSINATRGNPTAYGFQMVTLAGADDSNIGTWGTLPDVINKVNLLDREYIEHAMPLSENMVNVPWTAPSAGSGDVNIFATGNAVDREMNSLGDDPNSVQLTLSEAITSSTNNLATLQTNISIYPNPTFDNISVRLDARDMKGQIVLINILGKEMLRAPFDKGSVTASLQGFESGIYLLSIVDQDGVKISTRKVMKR